jgi:hypothetical protein
MKNKSITILTSLVFLIFFSCGNEQSDKELLEKDKANLQESLKTDKIAKYKFLKIAIRSSVPMENYPKEFLPFKEKLTDLAQTLNEADKEDVSIIEMASIYKDYLDLKEVIDETDEDVFPTLLEAIKNSNSEEKLDVKYLLKGNEKKTAETYEHAFLVALGVLSKDLGKEIVFYEASKIQPDKIENDEIKAIFQFYRSFVFMEKGLYYLSEHETTQNINWLNKNKDIEIKLVQALFGWKNFTNEQNYLAFHSLNHLLRGLDRQAMEREKDQEKALDDFEVFLEDFNKLGLNNELYWCIEAYINIKRENPEKAILALTNLKNSTILSTSDKKQIEKTIVYLKNRESDKLMNGVYDKAFISKIVVSFVYDKLSKMDWEKVFRENNIENGKEILVAIENFKELNKKIQEIKDMKYLEDNSTKLKEEGNKIWGKAKDLIK